MTVLVTDGNQRSTLAVVRSLGRAGIKVSVAEEEKTSLAGSSRFCARRVCYPSPARDPRGFQGFVRSESASGNVSMILPMTDVTTQLVAGIADSLDRRVRLPIPAADVVCRAQDKREVVRTAAKLGLGVPKTWMLDDHEQIETVAQQVCFPVVIKPRLSHMLRDGGWHGGNVQYASGAADLISKYRAADAQIPRPLVQEKLGGPGEGVFLLVWNGELKAAFAHRRLREKPPSGGVSVYRESIPLDMPLVERSLALLKALGWQGVAMVEYKIDERDGQAKVMEVNGRFWGSLQLAIDAGLDFPLMLYKLAMGTPVAPQLEYRVGVKTRWLLGDLDHLLIRLRHASMANGLPNGISNTRAVLRFLKFYEKDMHYEVQKLGDPGPGWYECKSYLREIFHRRQDPEKTHAG